MFRKMHPPATAVTIFVDGQPVSADAADSVAAVLLAAGVVRSRNSAVSTSPRAPYCMMGVCFECLVEIDGEPDRQACLTPVRADMHVRTVPA